MLSGERRELGDGGEGLRKNDIFWMCFSGMPLESAPFAGNCV
uniref:Uncharacterized protein n=1 Tax=Desertifilum tharense IPPAS B-1220 TaxID=1781255 RepID=A0ACD5GX20_9CYAN